MPSVINPERPGLSADAREQFDAELRVEAAKHGFDVDVASPTTGRAKSPTQHLFDAGLSAGADPFGEAISTAAAEGRAHWISLGYDPARYDRALRGSGIPLPPAATDPALLDLHREQGVANPGITPSAYSFDLSNHTLANGEASTANVHSTLAEWSTNLRLEPNLARGIGEYIVAEGPRLAKFDEGQRASWLSQQSRTLLKSCGGDKAAAAEIVAKATKVLGMSGTIAGNERFSDAIVNGTIGKSAWLLQTLAHHFDAMTELEIARKRL